jgi:hypothetical protein
MVARRQQDRRTGVRSFLLLPAGGFQDPARVASRFSTSTASSAMVVSASTRLTNVKLAGWLVPPLHPMPSVIVILPESMWPRYYIALLLQARMVHVRQLEALR